MTALGTFALGLLILLGPLRITVSVGSRSLGLPLADPLIWAMTGVALLLLLKRRERPKTWGAPALWAVLGAAALSMLLGTSPRAGLGELIQLVDYHLLLLLLLAGRIRRIAPIAVAALAAWGLVAASQIMDGAEPWLVRGVFRDASSFQVGVILLAPLALDFEDGRWRALAALVLGSVLATTGALTAVVLGGLAALLLWAWQRAPLLVPACALVGGLFAGGLLLPDAHRAALLRPPGLTLPMAERRQQVLQAKFALRREATPLFRLGPVALAADSPWALRPEASTDAAAGASTGAPPSGARTLHGQVAESWSALRLIADAGPTGRGLGRWGDFIGTGYRTLARTGTTFPNTANGYLLLAATGGPLLLAAWLLWCITLLRRGVRRRVRAASLVLGAGLLTLVICPWVTQPVAIYWALAAARVYSASESGTENSSDSAQNRRQASESDENTRPSPVHMPRVTERSS